MKRKLIPMLLTFMLIFTACTSQTAQRAGAVTTEEKEAETITYQSENGPIEVPANPQRVVVLFHSFTGTVMALDVNLVGVDPWIKMNPRFENQLKDVAEVTDESLEKIIELEPDLIIGLSGINNLDKLNKIAPTVTYTYGKLDYLTQILELGKLLNKEAEAQAWIKDFKEKAELTGKEIKEKIGEDATITVIESFDKELYVFGDNWGRGTEILYQAMKLHMPKKVSEMTSKDGYYAMSSEVLAEYVGDYLIFSKNPEADNSFQETAAYKNISAVMNNHVFEVNSKEFYYNDALTLEYQLEFFKKSLLSN